MKKNKMNKENYIDVVIPAYNAEFTLEKCVDSLLNQTIKNFRILIIDDGSRDNTFRVAKTLENKNPQKIRAIHQENSGVSVARNTGIANATSQYITFVDSDDFVEQNYLESLLTPFLENNIQLSVCGYSKEKNSKVLYNGMYKFTGVVTVKNVYERIFINQGIEGFVVNKLYKLELIKEHNLLFDKKIKIGEDLLFNIQYLNYVYQVYISDDPVYHYVVNESSTVNTTKIGKNFDRKTLTILEAFEQVIELVPSKLVNAQIAAKAQLANNASNIIRIIYLSNMNNKFPTLVKRLKNIMRINGKYVFATSIFDKKTKIKFIMNMLSPRLTVVLWNFVKGKR